MTAITAPLNHQNIDNNPERISKLKPFINNYNWKDIEFPSHSRDWKKLNKIIRQLLLISYMYHVILTKYDLCTYQNTIINVINR